MSHKAKKLIAQAQAKGWKRLDLGNCGLTDLQTQVPKLFELTDLEELVLSNWWWDKDKRIWIGSANIRQPNYLREIPEAIARLQQLKVLRCGGRNDNTIWEIRDITALKALNQLTVLDLSANQISDISALQDLTQLTELNLSGNQISDISAFPYIKQLTVLNLWGNQISDISALRDLTQLTKLGLDANEISDISALHYLTQLTKLYLGGNQISDISALRDLTQLTKLGLRANGINDISALRDLTQLAELTLSHNQIRDISALRDLKQLTELDLRDNQIGDISALRDLTQLSALDLRNNQIRDIGALHDLKQLSVLNLWENQISDISALRDLKQLSVLDLRNNQIRDIGALRDLKQLSVLNLNNNKISDISPLKKMPQLYFLVLNGNDISDIEPLMPLIRENELEIIAEWDRMSWGNGESYMKSKGKRYDRCVSVKGNPLTTPPMEIVAQGREAVLRYFERLQQGETVKLREAKILIVGEARVGKTSLLTKLIDENAPLPSEKGSTRGIDVRDIDFEKEGETYKVHYWDFGGQQIYRSTHNLFLTNRSLYILLDDSSRDDTRLSYWLQKTARLAGSDTPTLLVQNQRNDRQKAIDEKGLWGEFAQLRCAPKPFRFDFSLKTDDDRRALAALQRKLQQQIAGMSIVDIKVQITWARVREQLADWEKEKAFISRHELYALCAEHQISSPTDLADLSQLFHDLGVFLHFHEDVILKHLVILQKEWATDAIYCILDSTTIANKRKGRFCKRDAELVWQAADAQQRQRNSQHLSYQSYTDELIALMLKFELCYERSDAPQEYVIPQMLPVEQPNYDWGNTNQDIQLQYRYGSFMPEGILHRLIVRLHRFVTNLDEAWGRGCILYDTASNSKAEIIEPYTENRITIRAQGSQAKSLLSNIAYELDNINRSYGKEGLQPEKLVPCICPTCKALIQKGKAPHFYNYADLLRRKERGKPTVECSNSYEYISVLHLIDAVFVTNFFKPQALNVFISYSKEDKGYLDTLLTHLKPLVREGLIETWSDQDLRAGEEGDKVSEGQLLRANLILLLVSPSALATDYIWDTEITMAIKRHEQGQARVVPIILCSCMWESTSLGFLNALPDKGIMPINQYDNPDEAWKNIAQQIHEIAKEQYQPFLTEYSVQ